MAVKQTPGACCCLSGQILHSKLHTAIRALHNSDMHYMNSLVCGTLCTQGQAVLQWVCMHAHAYSHSFALVAYCVLNQAYTAYHLNHDAPLHL
jgi:hypothetical protein